MAKDSTFTKYTTVGVIAIMVGFFEGLGNYFFNYLVSIQIPFSPYVIPAVLGVAGFSLILYDFVKRRSEKKKHDEDEDDEERYRFFPSNTID